MWKHRTTSPSSVRWYYNNKCGASSLILYRQYSSHKKGDRPTHLRGWSLVNCRGIANAGVGWVACAALSPLAGTRPKVVCFLWFFNFYSISFPFKFRFLGRVLCSVPASWNSTQSFSICFLWFFNFVSFFHFNFQVVNFFNLDFQFFGLRALLCAR